MALVYRSHGGITCSLPECELDSYIAVSIHDLTDDISWLGVLSATTARSLTVEVREPCLSSHSFDVTVYLTKELMSRDGVIVNWSGLTVIREWTTRVPAFEFDEFDSTNINKRSLLPAWDNRHSCVDCLLIRSPMVFVRSETFSEAVVSWRPNGPMHDTDRWAWLVSMVDINDPSNKHFFFMEKTSGRQLLLPHWLLTTGNTFKLSVCGLAPSELDTNCGITGHWLAEYTTVEHRAVLTPSDLTRLLDRALQFCSRNSYVQCPWLYRNKSHEYFDVIDRFNFGIMETYLKDNSGDPGSPINGHLAGLFFMTAPDIDGEPPKVSQFGPRRIQIPTEVLLQMTPNVYFVDFYCMNGSTHYVTLVLTSPGSEADAFCRQYCLPLLDISSSETNPFLFLTYEHVYVNSTPKIQIELFITEDLNLYNMIRLGGARMSTVKIVGRGSSTPGGIPKNPECCICNLPRPGQARLLPLPTVDPSIL